MAEPTSHPRDVVADDLGQVRRRAAPAAVLARAAGIAALSGLAAAAGCGQGRTLLEPSLLSADPSGAQQSSALRGAVVVSDADRGWGSDEYVVNAAGITGDVLTLNVSYSGGCAAHAFTLVVSESFAGRSPATLAGRLAHDANGDSCEAHPMEDYEFDLGVIRSRYRAVFGGRAGDAGSSRLLPKRRGRERK
ncbi:MAG: hypothetical protein OXF93_06500 [Acidobacteria bacterium]|nr:hypothetical protein [Acidobacteriota bacterium]